MSTLQGNRLAEPDSGIIVTEIDDPIGSSAFEGILEAYRHQGYTQGQAHASREAWNRVRLAVADFLRTRTLDASQQMLIDSLLTQVDAALSAPDAPFATFVDGLGI